MAEEPGKNEQQPEQPVTSATAKDQIPLETLERKLSPRPSIWPIALAFTLVITLIGIIVHPILFICGVVLTIAVIIGWFL